MQLSSWSHRRSVWGALALAVSAAIAIPAASSAAGAGVTASTPRCATSGLVTWIDTSGNGAAGSIFYGLKFTNLSGSRCTLRGYPGVSAVNLGGHQLGKAASRNAVGTPKLVTLRNGGTATAILRIVEAGNFPPSICHPTQAAGVRVFPPNQTAAKVVPFPFPACSGSPVYLSIEAVR